jgi:hypothetical protein
VQQTPNPLAQDPDEVPPLFVHSELQTDLNENLVGVIFCMAGVVNFLVSVSSNIILQNLTAILGTRFED